MVVPADAALLREIAAEIDESVVFDENLAPRGATRLRNRADRLRALADALESSVPRRRRAEPAND